MRPRATDPETGHRPRARRVPKTRRRAVLSLAAAWLAVAAIGVGAPTQAAERFVDGFDDLPLMPGLVMVPEASMAFDTATGRIVVAFADEERAGTLGFDRVAAFYAATLPQLGWTEAAGGQAASRWTREGEELLLEAVAEAPELVVRFSLSPR